MNKELVKKIANMIQDEYLLIRDDDEIKELLAELAIAMSNRSDREERVARAQSDWETRYYSSR